MSNNHITNSVVSIESANNFGNISLTSQKLTFSPTIDDRLKNDLHCITCPVCHKEILTERFIRILDCCECLKPSKKTPTGNQLLAITAVNQFDINQKLVEEDSVATTKLTKPDSTKDLEATSSLIKCELCHKPMSTKRVRFECCDHLKFCFECGKQLDDCLKCKYAPSTSSAQSVKQPIECQYCGKIIQTRPLQFVDCDHGKMCRDCVNFMLDCPKCRK